VAEKVRALLSQPVKGLPLAVWCLALLAIFGAAALIHPGPAASPAEPELQLGGGALESTRMAVSVFAKLSLSAGLIYAAWILIRRWKGGLSGLNRQLILLETLHLSSRQALHLVRAGQQVLLIGGTDGALNLIGPVEIDLPPANPVEGIRAGEVAAPPAPLSFADLIGQRLANH
jgi:flagellar biogenesis protein FliO